MPVTSTTPSSTAAPSVGRRVSLAMAIESFGPYELYMLALCIFSIVVLGVDILLPLSAATKQVFGYTDTTLCVFFFVDFLRSFHRAPDKLRYFVRGGWLDLASSVPAVDLLRLGRLSRITRIFRVLRAMRSARTIDVIITQHRRQSVLFGTAIVAMLLLVFASIGILHVETGPDANITTAGDALWWAFGTLTTVGYGDHFPVTLEGRLIASVLMAAGLGLFGTISGLAASWFFHAGRDEDAARVENLTKEIAQLRTTVEALATAVNRGADPDMH
jgi:voltage-gated potassium channel